MLACVYSKLQLSISALTKQLVNSIGSSLTTSNQIKPLLHLPGQEHVWVKVKLKSMEGNIPLADKLNSIHFKK